jgi:predicted flap endonuclease-1-like 5' DNA nuclease
MRRWLTRLFVFAVLAAVAAFAIIRFMNRDEDFDEYEDIDAGFEFQETPVEIDVAAEEEAAAPDAPTATATAAAVAEPGAGPGVIDVKGIGPAYEARLQALGIYTLQDLVNADPQNLTTQLAPRGGQEEIEDWIGQARQLLSGETQA